MSFAQLNLDPSIVKAIHACGYTTLTPIQARSIPDILNGKDVVASAQTGTGKTAAFVLPALHRVSLQKSVRKPRILILTPTRELASQITKATGKYGKFLRFNIASLVGGMSYHQQIRDLSRQVDIVVATPGRLLDHMDNRRLDLSGIEMLILDEADRMLDMGFIDDVQAIAKATPNNRQTLLFSATVDNQLAKMVSHLLKNPVRIDISAEKIAPTHIKQELFLADNPQHRARILQHMIDNDSIFKGIIFTATKIGADKLAGQLRDQGYQAAALHGDLKQKVRNRTVEELRRGKVQFVVATDVAARGIDIVDMTHVINYDLPKFCEDYVHRIGRTGRAGKSGKAISFALPSDGRHVQRIEKYIGHRLELVTIAGLEPKSNHVNPNPPKAKRKRGKPTFSKSDRFESRHRKPNVDKKSDRAQSSFRRTKETHVDKIDSSRPSYAKSERVESGRGRPSYARSDRAESRRDRPSYAKSDRAEPKRDRPSYAKSDRAEPKRERPSYAKSDRAEPRRDRPSYAKSDRTKSNRSRASVGKSDRDKPSYAAKPSKFKKNKQK